MQEDNARCISLATSTQVTSQNAMHVGLLALLICCACMRATQIGRRADVKSPPNAHAGVLVALKLGHPVEGENDPDYKVHLREWDSYMRLGAVVSEVPNIQQFGIAAGVSRARWHACRVSSVLYAGAGRWKSSTTASRCDQVGCAVQLHSKLMDCCILR